MASKLVDEVEGVISGVLHPKHSYLEYGLPTLDRPFGVALWPIFVHASKKYLHWDPSAFDYKYDSKVPMSSVPSVFFAIVAYYVTIFGGRWLLTRVRPIKFGVIFKLHNLFLTLLSLLLLLLLVEQLVPHVARNGLFYGICSPAMWTGPIVTLYYLNYLTKFYELLDTLFLVFRKRPLTFLHTYHHGATAVLCFSQLNGRTSVSWVPITLNLLVHVVMYFYYFLSAFGIRPWWKHWVTRLQIIQFVIDLGFVYFASYTYFTAKYWPHLPNMGTCAGSESAAINGCLILTSYLLLFISFYIKVYLAPKLKTPVAKVGTTSKVAATPSSAKSSSKSAPKSKKTTRSRRA